MYLRKAGRFVVRTLRFLLGRSPAIAVATVLIGMLAYSAFVLAHGEPESRGTGFATLATGVALAAVTYLTYRIERRNLQLASSPILGVIWKEPHLSPHEEVGGTEKPIAVEFLFWNAGTIPILVFQPSANLYRGLRCTLGHYEPELDIGGNPDGVSEKPTFPIVLARGQRCIWRLTMPEKSEFTPQFAHYIGDNPAKLFEWYKDVGREEDGIVRFAFDVQYSGEAPHSMRRQRIHRQYLGFAYKAPKTGTEEKADV